MGQSSQSDRPYIKYTSVDSDNHTVASALEMVTEGTPTHELGCRMKPHSRLGYDDGESVAVFLFSKPCVKCPLEGTNFF